MQRLKYKKYLTEAKSVIEGSESKEKLLEAIENLSNALREAQRTQEMNLEVKKVDLNTYMRYCNRTEELLYLTEKEAPSASKLIRRGLPIINDRIKSILCEIQKRSEALCKQTKDTLLENLGKEVNLIGQTFLKIKDTIGLEKAVKIMQNQLSNICSKLPEEEKGEACEYLREAKEEIYIEDKLDLINIVLSKISPQIGKMKNRKNIKINISGNQSRVNIESIDKSINITGDLLTDFESLRVLIERDYKYKKV